MERPFVSGRVSSHTTELQRLHDTYGWMIGREHIRPVETVMTWKKEALRKALVEYVTYADSILVDLFGCTSELVGSRRMASPFGKEEINRYVFVPSMFPYQVPQGTFHYIIWYLIACGTDKDITEDQVNQNICTELCKLFPNREFEFGWYENPKSTIGSDARICHAQVFWHFKDI